MNQRSFIRIQGLLNKAQSAIEDIKTELSTVNMERPCPLAKSYKVKFECEGEVFDSENVGLNGMLFNSKEEAEEAIRLYRSDTDSFRYFAVLV